MSAMLPTAQSPRPATRHLLEMTSPAEFDALKVKLWKFMQEEICESACLMTINTRPTVQQ